MAISFVTVWQPGQGRAAELRERFAAGKAIHERHGARVYAVQTIASGPNTGRMAYVMTYEGPRAMGRSLDAINADPAWQALVAARDTTPNGPGTVVGQTIASEVPGFEQGVTVPAPGSVMTRVGWRVHPGRFADSVAQVAEVKAALARHGVTYFRFTLAEAGGPDAGTLAVSIGAANFTEWGERTEKIAADASYQALLARIQGAGAPWHSSTQGLSTVIAL